MRLPALPSSSHEETSLVAQSGQAARQAAPEESPEESLEAGRAAGGIVRLTMVLSTRVLSQ